MGEIEAAALLEQQVAMRGLCRIPAAIQAGLPARPNIFEMQDGVGLIRINGPLLNERDPEYDYFGIPYTTYDQVAAAADALRSDPNVRGVVLAIDSPGGDAVGVSAAADALAALRAEKPTAAWTGRMMASAAYFLGSQAQRVTATVDAMVGSIGTVMAIPEFTGLLSRIGINFDIFRTGPLKYTGNGFEKLSDGQRAYLQSTVEQYGEIFKSAVARGRGRSAEWVNEVASGRTWIAGAAAANGLIDGVGTLSDALGAMRAATSRALGRPNSEETIMSQTNQIGSAANTAGAVQASPAAPAGPANAVAAPAPASTAKTSPSAASVAEIKAGCPGASDAFVVSCIERGATLDTARSEWMSKLSSENEQLRKPPATAGPASTAPKGGTAVAFAPSAAAPPASADDDEALKLEFERMTAEEKREYGGAREYAHYRKAQAAGKVNFAGK